MKRCQPLAPIGKRMTDKISESPQSLAASLVFLSRGRRLPFVFPLLWLRACHPLHRQLKEFRGLERRALSESLRGSVPYSRLPLSLIASQKYRKNDLLLPVS